MTAWVPAGMNPSMQYRHGSATGEAGSGEVGAGTQAGVDGDGGVGERGVPGAVVPAGAPGPPRRPLLTCWRDTDGVVQLPGDPGALRGHSAPWDRGQDAGCGHG